MISMRRLIVKEQLVVSRSRYRCYSSYCGEISPAPDNLLARDFKAASPNQSELANTMLEGAIDTLNARTVRRITRRAKGFRAAEE